MNTSPRHEKEDILINFRDLLVHILLRWRSILAVVILMTLLAGGAKLLLDYRDYKNALNAAPSTAPTLSATEQANVDNALGYHKAYEAAVAYNSTAPMMRIDPQAVHIVTLTFTVKSANSFNTAAQYQPLLKDASLYAALVEEEGIAYNHNLLPDLVSSSVLHRAETGTAAPAEPVLLRVLVLADSETLCRNIAERLIAKLNAQKGCTLVGQVYSLAADASVKNTQISNLNTANALRSNLEKATDALTDREAAALEQLIAGEATDDGTVAQPVKPSVSKKFLVLGFIAGGALMVVVYALGYLVDRRVKSPEDLQERYGLYHMGTLPATGKARFLDRWITGLFRKKSPLTPEESRAVTAEQLRLAAADGALLITGSALTDEDVAHLQTLAETLQKAGVALTVAPCPLRDAAAMEALSKAGAVVLAEKQRVSAYGDIYAMLELCERLDTPVRGALLLSQE